MDTSTAVDSGATATQRRSNPPPASPSAYSSSPSPPPPTTHLAFYPGYSRSLAGIATRAFCLGAALVASTGLGIATAALPVVALQAPWLVAPATAARLAPLWRLPAFLSTLAVFHFLEFWTTATYNTPAASTSSFLLTANWPAYGIAHAAACVEVALHWAVFRERWWLAGWTVVPGFAWVLPVTGLLLVVLGQTVRTAAMVHAGHSFNHTIQRHRATSHALVTTGVYGWLRHPSYFGFFWWALGTQLVLGNTLCLAGYAAVLWRFFSMRIRHEERLLVSFFGDDYVTYSARVGTKIPFI